MGMSMPENCIYIEAQNTYLKVGPIFQHIVSASIMWEWSQTLLNRRPIDGSVQDSSISTANALDASALAVEILQFYSKPSICNMV